MPLEIARQFALRTDILENLRHNFGETPTPKQAEVLQAIGSWQHKRIAIKSANTWGKTRVAADVVIDWLSRKEQPLVVTTGPTDRAVKQYLWKELKRIARPRATQYGWEILPDAAMIKKNDEVIAMGFSTTDAGLFEGFHETMTTDQGQVSGQLLVVVDEAKAVHDRIYEAIDSTDPEMLVLISTPGNPKGRFFEAFTRERQDMWQTFTISGEEYNDSTGERVRSSWITDMLNTYGRDSPIYRRRVLAEFSLVSERPYFSADAIDAAMSRMLPDGSPNVLGVDWGKRIDFTACVQFKGRKVQPRILLTQQDYMTTVDQIEQWHREEPLDFIVSDLGAGEAQVEEMQRRRLPVEGFRFTSRSKLDIMSNLKLLLEGNELDLPDPSSSTEAAELEEQLKAFEHLPARDESGRGQDSAIRLGAPPGQHDDLVDATALAASKLSQPRRRLRIGMMQQDARRQSALDGPAGRQVT